MNKEGEKTGGRQAGATNRLDKTCREVLCAALTQQVESGKVQQELDKLEGRQYLEMLLKLSKLLVARPQPEPAPPKPKQPEARVRYVNLIFPVGTEEEEARLPKEVDDELFKELLEYSERKSKAYSIWQRDMSSIDDPTMKFMLLPTEPLRAELIRKAMQPPEKPG